MKRTHLPLNALRVFDAAARHLSFTRAADELAVTPAAVGQQIRALEDMLGVVLFRRDPKGLVLTPEAEAGLDSLRSGFLLFEDSVRAMQAGQSSHRYTIAAPRDLAARWLTGRLAMFAATRPETRFTMLPADEAGDFTEANLDLAIRFCDGPEDLEGLPLGDARAVTVATPGLASEARIDWHGARAEPGAPEPLLTVGDAGLALDAALAGLGTATVPQLLAAGEIASGRLVVRSEREARRRYWLVAPLPQWRQKKVRELVAALTAG